MSLPCRARQRWYRYLIGGAGSGLQTNDEIICPVVRAGLLDHQTSGFSCVDARWFYIRQCYPNRFMTVPANFDALVVSSVKSMSAKKLRDTLDNGFPKEATFQHLFNEAVSMHLPIEHFIIPELNTFAKDPKQIMQEVTLLRGSLTFTSV
jgi:hypothetical protein